MKVSGIENTKDFTMGPLVFPRGKHEDGSPKLIGFYAQPVWSMSEFDDKFPRPVSNYTVFTRDGKRPDDEHPAFLATLAAWRAMRWGFIIMKTLEPSRIEWDRVRLDDPSTWANAEDELRENLTGHEFNKLLSLISDVNSMDDDKLSERVESFFQQAEGLQASGGNGQNSVAESS